MAAAFSRYCLLLAVAIQLPWAAFGEDLEAPTASVDLLSLAEEPQWRLLMHYVRHPLTGQLRILVDDRRFFLAKHGRMRPTDELRESIRHLFSSRTIDERCRFPARYLWLSSRLSDRPSADVLSECPALREWLSKFRGATVTFVYAGAFFRNPASMFGHTFLRFDLPRSSGPTPLLDLALSFAARNTDSPGLLYAYRGLTGGYQGRYSLTSYDHHVQQYGDLDDRDLWEFPLALTADELTLVLLHLWELKDAHFDYYFLDENCSYHLLALLNVARPSVDLLGPFGLFAFPTDTLRRAVEQFGTGGEPTLRPSRSRLLREKESRLSERGKELLHLRLVDPPVTIAESNLSDQELAIVLETELLVREAEQHNAEPSDAVPHEELLSVLTERNALNIRPLKPTFPTTALRPDRAHGSSRAGLGVGIDRKNVALTAGLRFAYHNELDPIAGFPDGHELELLGTDFEFLLEHDQLRLREAVLFRAASLPERMTFHRPLSWRLRLDATRRLFQHEQRPLVPRAEAALGATWRLTPTLRYSVLPHGLVMTNEKFDDAVSIATGMEMTSHWDPHPHLRQQLTARVDSYLHGFNGTNFALTATHRYTINQQLALTLSLSRHEEFGPAEYRSLISANTYY
ncbi:MAG: DUF4105 domain-containing protein [Bdellovibrionales bacterium]|nr:DUF4105 domain-containing protein [Bdellovibrionales bacterium]